MTQILGATGAPLLRVGGPAAFREYTKGDIRCALQWFTDPEQSLDEEPSMFITCPSRSKGVFVIPLRDLHQFVDPMGNYAAKFAAAKAIEIAECLGLDVTSRSTMTFLMDSLYEILPDLLKMPPKPFGMRLDGSAERPGMTATIFQEGKAIAEHQTIQ